MAVPLAQDRPEDRFGPLGLILHCFVHGRVEGVALGTECLDSLRREERLDLAGERLERAVLQMSVLARRYEL